MRGQMRFVLLVGICLSMMTDGAFIVYGIATRASGARE